VVVSVFDVDCCVVDNSSVVVSVFDVDCCVVDNSSVVVSVFDVDCCVVDNSICDTENTTDELSTAQYSTSTVHICM
jgi:hypothetical protein